MHTQRGPGGAEGEKMEAKANIGAESEGAEKSVQCGGEVRASAPVEFTYSYEGALQAAGATVHQFQSFGSYHGDWWAFVTHNDKTGWVHGYYGSCPGCDALEAEFGYGEQRCEEHRYDIEKADDCDHCVVARQDYERKFVEFGRGYLDDVFSQDEAEKIAAEYSEYGCDDEKPLEFIKATGSAHS